MGFSAPSPFARADAGLPPPRIEYRDGVCLLHGDWTLQSLRPNLPGVRAALRRTQGKKAAWDLTGVTRVDSFGALLLWRAWDEQEPATLTLPPTLHTAFGRVLHAPMEPPAHRGADPLGPLVALGERVMRIGAEVRSFIATLGQVVVDSILLLPTPRHMPWRETGATLYKAGVTALPIAALLGFLIGLVLAYLMAFQLRNFGAEALVVNVLGIGITREIGPMLVSVLVTGRSGSAFTAQIGTMRVTEEIDALAAMGVSRHQRLVLPKVIALAIAMPLLVAWTSAAALLGGMVIAHTQLDIDILFFAEALQRVVPIQNLYIGLFKGSVFGITIALIACHFGLRVKPNTESLSANTTASVVASISLVIMLDALIAVLTRTFGMAVR